MAYRDKLGFTIVELMIAISVFTVAMVLVLAGVLYISRQYQQSNTKITLNEASRNIHQEIAESIKFSGVDVEGPVDDLTGNYKAYCVGNYMYIYGSSAPINLLSDYTSQSATKKGLYRKQNLGCTSANITTSAASGAVNILPDNAFVSRFVIDNNSISTTFVSVPNNGSDLLNFPILPVTIDTTGIITCKAGIAGKEFCAATTLESSVSRRVE